MGTAIILILQRKLRHEARTEINSEYTLEGLIPKLKLQYFGHLMQRANSLEMTLILGRIEGRRRTGRQRMRWLDGITNSMDRSLSKSRRWWRTGKTGVLQSTGSQRVGNDLATEQRHNHVAGKWVSQNWNLGDLSPKPMPLSVDSWWEIHKQSSETHGDCARSCGIIGDPVWGEAGSVSEGSVSSRGVFLRVGLQGGHFRKSIRVNKSLEGCKSELSFLRSSTGFVCRCQEEGKEVGEIGEPQLPSSTVWWSRILALWIGSSIPFFSRFYIYALIYNICFSLSDLLHSVQQGWCSIMT